MSVWKKAAKSHQKTHRERHQPEERKHLGVLQKKKDYVLRARDYNEKKDTLKVLHKRALNKNPDEFYHHMINSKIEDGRHFEKEAEEEDTPEQIRLMRHQDLRYIITKRTQEAKKIEKLQSQLHLSSVSHNFKNKHIRFSKNAEESETSMEKRISKMDLSKVDVGSIAVAAQKKKQLYAELVKRITREKQLAVIQQKVELKKALENKKNILPPKKVKKGNVNNAAIYEWKYERKK